jgi:ubiquinone/menaquinone biosynthesis C-methylase UbiE
MSSAKELAYRYDLFIAPDWRDRFDTLVNESIELPTEGRILDVNCGTGEHAIELADRMRGKGEVIGIDPSAERIDLARAKAQAKKTEDVTFEQAVASDVPFDSHRFDAVIGDASMLPADQIEEMLVEMVRVTQPDGRIILKMATHGSFDEFFSIYWEALHDLGIDNEIWSALEQLINERSTVSDAESMVERSGLRNVQSFVTKEEFRFNSAKDFLESPLIKDAFLAEWVQIVPEPHRNEVLDHIVSIIERDRRGASFDVSIKATVIAGVK